MRPLERRLRLQECYQGDETLFTDFRKQIPGISQLPLLLAAMLCKLQYPEEPERVRRNYQGTILGGQRWADEQLSEVSIDTNGLELWHELSFKIENIAGKVHLKLDLTYYLLCCCPLMCCFTDCFLLF